MEPHQEQHVQTQAALALDDAQAILEHFGRTVFSAAYAMVKNRHDAEDIAQDVFVSYIRTKPHFESMEHAKAWMLRVTINKSKSFFRSAWQQKTVGIEEDFPDARFTQSELDVMDAVERLPLKYRRVIYLYYIEGYASNEIASILELPQNTVLSQLARARKQLKISLKGELQDEQQ